MKRIIYMLITALIFTVGCSKKEKKYLPFSSTSGDSGTLSSSGASTNVTGATLSKITVSPADQSIAKNTHGTYKATGVYSDGTIKDITADSIWSVKTETDKVSTVSSFKGKFLGTTPTSVGSPAVVTASVDSISGNANLNVTNANLSSIQIVAVPSLIPGGSVQYQAIGIFDDGTTQDVTSLVTWASDATSSVAIDATTGIGTGGSTAATATISATISTTTFPGVANGGVASTTTQLKNVTVVSITITGNGTVSTGSTNGYIASAIYSDGTSADITSQATWSLNSSSNAAINDNTGSKGILTSISAGSVAVQATFGGVTGSKNVTISSATVTSVAVSPSAKSIVKGTSTQFTATATYSDGTTVDVTNSAIWSSSNASVAGVNTSTSTGGLSQGITGGSSTITATIGGVSGSGALTVSTATLQSIAINGNATIAKGTIKQYTATGTYSDGSTQDITSLVTWTSSSSNLVSVSNGTGTHGLATGVAQGSSTIQATLGGVNSNTSTLSVSAATLSSIAIGGSASVENGATKQYTATGTFSDASTQDLTSLVTWVSSSTTNATISNGTSDKGKAYALAIGSSNITAQLVNGTNGIVTGGGTITSNSSVLTVTAPATATTSTSVVSGYDVTVPSGMKTVTAPTGDFSGITYQGDPSEVAGFVSTVQYSGTAGCTSFGATLLTAMVSDSPDKIITNNQITSSTIGTNPDCSAVYVLAVTVNANMTVTEVSNHLIEQIGKAVPGGTISNLPVSAVTETPATTFRVVLQATYSTSGNELVGVAVSRESDYANNEALIASLLDGTNINPTGSTNTAKTDSFVAEGDPKVDFVWVVDNSGSMAQEQSTVGSNAVTFFNSLNGKHLDFRLGVIATGSNGESGDKCTTSPSGSKAWELWGSSQDNSKWVYKADTGGSTQFQTNVTSVGTSGCGSETSIFHAQRALGAGPNPVTATITPRTGAKLIFVALTDEGEFYASLDSTWNGKTTQANYIADNIFKTNGYKWYAIMGLDANNQPGACSYNTLAGQTNSATNTALYELVTATGGSAATICATSYAAILDNIATQAAGNASIFVLTKTPVSSTIIVKKNGVTVSQNATNGWSYNSATKTIVFSGTSYPTAGDTISVSYQYNSSANVAFGNGGDNNLMAYISKTAKSDTARGAAAAIALLVGAILAGRIWRRKNS